MVGLEGCRLRAPGTNCAPHAPIVGERQQAPRNGNSELSGGLETDHESKLARLLNREIAGLGAAEDFCDLIAGIIGLERRRTARLLASVR